MKNADEITDASALKDVSNLEARVQTAHNDVSIEPSKLETKYCKDNQNSSISNPNKKRVVESFADDGNTLETHKMVVLTLEDICMRRQQMKVLTAMKEHHFAKESLTGFGDARIQTVVTNYMKPKSGLMERKLSDLEAASLLVKLDPFQPDGVLDPNDFHFGHTLESYEAFIEEEQEKANRNIQRKLYVAEKKPLLQMPNLAKCGWMRCSGCGNLIINCHDVVFGPFCVYKSIKYCTEMQHYAVSDIALKKVFLDTYNRCLAFVMFKSKEKKVHNKWIFPPLCVQDNSYSYILFWFEWIVEGIWTFEGDKKKSGDTDEDGEDEDGDY